jgi:phage anti-repressor protein
MMEKKEKTLWPGTPEYKAKFGDEMRTGEKKKSSTGGEIEKTATGVKHTRSYDDDDAEDNKADDGAPRKKGRPKGSKRALGAKVKGTSKLHSKPAIREMGMEDEESVSIVDKGEYDREGDMAKEQLHTAADAARELHDILDSDENLPEWVQSKITKAMDYLDTARDYMKASDSEDEEEMAERKLTKPEMKKREEVVKSMKKSKGDFEKRYQDGQEEGRGRQRRKRQRRSGRDHHIGFSGHSTSRSAQRQEGHDFWQRRV